MSHGILEIIIKLLLLFFSIFHEVTAKVFLSVSHEISFQLKKSDNKCGPPEPQKGIWEGKKGKKGRSPTIKILINIK